MVETTIDLDELENHSFIIKADFDEELRAIKVKMDRVRASFEAEHRRAADQLGMEMDQKTLHFEQHSLYGRCFRLTRKVRARTAAQF